MKIFALFALILCFASCSKDYHNKIVGRQVAQSCAFSPLTDSVQALLDAGDVREIPAANAGSNPQFCDSVYIVEFTLYQKWGSGNKWMLVVGIAIVLIGMGIYVYLTSNGQNAMWTLMIAFGSIVIGGSFIGGFYYFNTEREIRKMDYMKYGGDLESFWSTAPQTY
ncbi:MAG TPA: hypothetical protein VFE32_17500 [Puia sp.]|jgi:hypothetical protein|nr:hypothetical protein [Puia sp.]